MAGHRSDELVALDRIDPERIDGSHGGRSRDVAQESDLTEEVTRPELPRRAVVELHRGRAGGYGIEVAPRLAA